MNIFIFRIMMNQKSIIRPEIKLLILLLIIMTAGCSKNPLSEIRDKIEGRWVEIYRCNNNHCNYASDSILASVVLFNKKSFSSFFYRDSLQTVLDTTFSGRYSVSNDTLRLTLDNFSEVFYFNFLNNNYLYLEAVYSVDSGGNTIIDFHSVLWCCDKKKTGRFAPH